MQKASSWLGSKFEELLGATARIFPGGVIARCGWDTRKPLVIMRPGGNETGRWGVIGGRWAMMEDGR